MDLRLLRYFITVAELEHIGKAAERLHISQSPLSRQIRELEKELQMELFVRERQRIRLTSSGRWLLHQAQGLVAHSDKVREQAAERARGRAGALTVCFTSAAMWDGTLPKLLGRFQTAFPNATLKLQNMRSALQVEAIRSGRADIGFVAVAPKGDDIQATCVSEETSMLLVSNDHPLARKRRIAPRDLDGARWILLLGSPSSQKQDFFVAACAKAGFQPQAVQQVTEPIALLALAASGLGVGLIRDSARNYAPRSLSFVALPWFSFKSRTYMIRPAGGGQPLADTFATYAPEINMGAE